MRLPVTHTPTEFYTGSCECEMLNPLTIFNIVGARPNLVKIAPLMREMGKHVTIQPILVHTCQHYDEKLPDVFFRQMGIPAPDFN